MGGGLAPLIGLALGLAACAPIQGWQRTDQRACDPSSAPIVCLMAEPEGPHELTVGDRVLLPGECIVGPAGEGGGRVRTTLRTSGAEVARPAIGVRKGMRSEVRIEGDRVRVVERKRCDGRVETDAGE